MIDEKKQFLKDVIGFSLLTWFTFAVSFVASPISTRLFSPDEIGRVNMFHTYSGFVSGLAYFGLDNVLNRFYYNPPASVGTKSLFSFCIKFSTIVILIEAIPILIFWRFFSSRVGGEADLSIAICLIIEPLMVMLMTYFQYNNRLSNNVKAYNVQGIVTVIAYRVLYLTVGIWVPTYKAAIISLTVSYTIVTVIFSIVQRKNLSLRREKRGREFMSTVFKFALPFVPLMIIGWINSSASQILLESLMDYNEVGIYSTAVGLAGLIAIVETGFSIYWGPYVYRNYENQGGRFWTIHKLICCGLTIFSLLLVLAQFPVFLMFGEKYRVAAQFFPVLLISKVCATSGGTVSMGIGISKKTYWNIVITIASIAVNVGLCFLLIPTMGVMGVSIAVAASAVVSMFMSVVIGEHYYKATENHLYLLACALIVTAAAVINYIWFNDAVIKYSGVGLLLIVSCFIFNKELKMILKTTDEVIKLAKERMKKVKAEEKSKQ